ncbi:hypothetical protein [Methylobacterium sp. SyP6R]|uniref:hypothetical protein n=1 Tax=Methylobacterium sp. SyP6R TaxID=2718876 RepID=UPI001F2CA391|nr:hypothetical protein [Methylobacterium sp. SyP6R]MCF4129719.1 hypothetical protein [Methylobacterium sp. SyP6R]
MQATLVDRGVAPSRSSVFEGEGMRAWASQKPVRRQWVAAVSEISRRGTGDYASPTDRVPETREIIGRAAQKVVLGQKTPQQAACDADAALLKLQQQDPPRLGYAIGRVAIADPFPPSTSS